MAQLYWKRQKGYAYLQNRRQWQREFDPQVTVEIEILAENGYNIVHETLTDPNFNNTPFNIIAEHLNVTN